MGLGDGVRVDGLVMSVFKEGATPTFVQDGSFEANKKQLAGVTELDAKLTLDPIENEAIRSNDAGAHPNSPKPRCYASPLTLTRHMIGLETPAGDTILADVDDPSVVLLAACLGGTPVACTGSKVASATDGKTFIEDVIDAHAVGDYVGLLDSDGCIHVRRIDSYNGGTGEMVLNLALPFTPSADDVIFGSVRIPFAEKHGYYMQGDVISPENPSPRNKEFYGAVGTFSRSASAGDATPSLSYSFQTGDHLRGGDADKAQIDAPGLRPVVAAGGTYTLQKADNTTAALYLEFLDDEFDLRREYSMHPNGNVKRNINSWVHKVSKPMAKIHVHETESLPTGFTAADFYASWQAGGSENRYRLLMAFGIEAGAVVGYHMRECMLQREPDEAGPGDVASLQLDLQPVSGGTEPLIEWFVM